MYILYIYVTFQACKLLIIRKLTERKRFILSFNRLEISFLTFNLLTKLLLVYWFALFE